MNKHSRQTGQVVFLGSRWPEGAPVAVEGGLSDWLDHYAAHAGFPVPAGSGPTRTGSGTMVVDATDFAAVQTSHSYGGDWLILACLPDVYGIRDQYEVRLRQEALAYGGLRDLELRAVARPAETRAVFVLDTPGREADFGELAFLAQSLWDLRDALTEPLRPSPRWPAKCRTVGVDGHDAGRGDADTRWERIPPPLPGELLPAPARRARPQARLAVGAEETIFRCCDAWLAVGRALPLSAFLVSGIYYQSLCAVAGCPEPAWPEPGDPRAEAVQRFVARFADKRRAPRRPGDVFTDLARRSVEAPVKLPPGLPRHVLAWLGRNDMDGVR